MHKSILGTLIIPFLAGCSASLPDQCKQITAITKEYTEITEPIRSKARELEAEQLFQKSKKIDKLQLSDNSLKPLQQKLVSNYDNWAKATLTAAGVVKQQELSAKDSSSADNLKKQIDISQQLTESGSKVSEALKENIELTESLKQICPN